MTPTRSINAFAFCAGAYADLGNGYRNRVTRARRVQGRLYLTIGINEDTSRNEVALIAPVEFESAQNPHDTLTVSP